MMEHVSHTRQHDQFGMRHGLCKSDRMRLGRNDEVYIAAHDERRRSELGIARGLRGEIACKVRDIARIGEKGRRPQQKQRRGALEIIRWRQLRQEG